jgi:hypothetical protein
VLVIRSGQRIDSPGRAYLAGEAPPPGSEAQHAEWLRIGVLEEAPAWAHPAHGQPATSLSASPSPDVAELRAENAILQERFAALEALMARLGALAAAPAIAAEPSPVASIAEPEPLPPEPVVVRDDVPPVPAAQPERRGPGRPRRG